MSLAMYYVYSSDNVPSERFLLTEQFVTEDERQFYDKLALRRAQVFDNKGCLGRYSLCENDLIKIGYFISEEGSCSNDLVGSWSDKYGIDSRDRFLLMPLIQDRAMKELSSIYYKNIYYYDLNKFIDTVSVTPASLIAIMHLYGSFEVINFFHEKSNLGESIKRDLANFAKYNIAILDSYEYGKAKANIDLLSEQKCYPDKT